MHSRYRAVSVVSARRNSERCTRAFVHRVWTKILIGRVEATEQIELRRAETTEPIELRRGTHPQAHYNQAIVPLNKHLQCPPR
jgi:hypothetical protein